MIKITTSDIVLTVPAVEGCILKKEATSIILEVISGDSAINAPHRIQILQEMHGMSKWEGIIYAARSLHSSSKDFVATLMINQDAPIILLD